MTCSQAPVNGGGGSSGAPEGGFANDSSNTNGGDVGVPDQLDIVDVGVNLDAPIPP